ncbi:hypothetical protein NW768_009308 [Fusarium equiseti]|uniref:Uncharacterized protein n=1 Tax=Fusarium equiseti TaxID=61235 RepID=A0ABQ8R3G7_FUSEQ|nr:hypothetical protein NW768_009308 [Fusarium equiseti]
MIRLYILLCLLPCLLLTTPFTHAALLPRLRVPFDLPGAVFHEPETRSLNVVPFKGLPGQSHHGHRLHHTLSLVKRLVEDQGDMVEVTEEALQELLDQINRLHDQVNGMMPSGASDRQPSQETDTSSGDQSDRLPGGSSGGPSGNGQSEQLPEQEAEAEAPESAGTPDSSVPPVVSDPSVRPELPAPTDENVIPLESQPSSAPDQAGSDGQSQPGGTERQADSALAAPTGNPTLIANDESPSPPNEDLPEGQPDGDAPGALTEPAAVSGNRNTLQSDDLPNNAIVQPTGEAEAPAETQYSVAQDARPTEAPQNDNPSSDSGDKGSGETSVLPGGAFVESPEDILQTLSSDVASAEQTGDPAPEETQGSSPPDDGDDECVEDEEVSGLPVRRRNPNCTPGNRQSASETTKNVPAALSLVATTEIGLAEVAATASELATFQPATEIALVSKSAEGPAPALETEATSTPAIKVVDSQQLGTPTPIASPPAVSGQELPTTAQLSLLQTSPSLRTLVFTSVLTRSSTIKTTKTRTEIVNAGEPTRSLKPPGHVFKEDADAGAAFNKNGKLAVEDDDNENEPPETPLQRTPIPTEVMTEITSLRTTRMAMTTTISLSYWSTMSTPEATQESAAPSLVPSGIRGGNGTYDVTPTTGFRTIPRLTTSLAESGGI